MKLRPATPDDLDDVVALTRARRHRLAEWSPVYFNPSANADDGHAAFLGFLLGSHDHDTRVFVDDDGVVGFLQLVEQPTHTWVDDFCVASDDHWPEVVGHLATLDPPWATCVSRHDNALAGVLDRSGISVGSTYFSRLLVDLPSADGDSHASRPATAPATPPAHTFGGRPMDPAAAGALVVDDGAGGLLVGSPGVTPPIYDPGGPTCVVDRIEGTDRSGLLHRAMHDAADRGDAQMIVVGAPTDTELQQLLVARGFAAQVDLFCAKSLSNTGEEMSGH